jgi:hypothetical protein
MTPNGDEDNEDGNSKNNDKATMKPPTTTEEGERRQSLRDNGGGGHRRPRDAAIAPTAASSRHTFVGSCCFRVGLRGLNSLLHMGIHRKSGRNTQKHLAERWNGWPANRSRFFTKSQKVGHEKIWRR